MRRTIALLTMLVLIGSLFAPSLALSPVVQHAYSAEANSGIRHEVCTTLNGTNADGYYTGEYTFDLLSAQTGDPLLQSLRTLMTDTHTYKTSYSQCRDLSVKTDCEIGDGQTISLLYCSDVSNRGEFLNDTPQGWNREHVWPKSLGGFENSGAGSDLHHVRPSDSIINERRGNLLYGQAENGKEVTGTTVTDNALGGHSNGTYFEPLDNVKGDVARICLYVYVRYGGELSKCSDITNVFQSVDVLLSWCALDPVDTWEMGRNEVVYGIQGNRNVFIDYPELAWLMFDREIPADLVTPSQSMCDHADVAVLERVEPTCNQAGSTGNSFCVDCGKWIAGAQVIPATGEHIYGQWEDDPENGGSVRQCTHCGLAEYAATEPKHDGWIWIVVAVVGVAAVAGVVTLIVIRKKQ